MPYTKGLCQKIQTNMLAVFGANAPSLKRKQVGFLQFLLSSFNTSGFQQVQPNGGVPGKKRGIIITFDDPACFDAARVARACGVTNDDSPSPNEFVFEVPANPFQPVNGGGQPLTLMFDEDEMAKLCENNAEHLSRHIAAWIGRMTDNIDKALLSIHAANWGAFADGTTYKSLPLFASPTGVSQPLKSASNSIMKNYRDIIAPGTPAIIGDGNFWNYNNNLGNACCNQFGVNMQTSGLWNFFTDQYAESIWGTNAFGVFAPGAVQLVKWSRYKGREKSNDTFAQGTIVDPFTGLEFDIKIIYDYDCEKWRVHIYLYADLLYVQGEACGLDPDINNTQKYFGCAEAEDYTCSPVS